jgi:hypothetical protein
MHSIHPRLVLTRRQLRSAKRKAVPIIIDPFGIMDVGTILISSRVTCERIIDK